LSASDDRDAELQDLLRQLSDGSLPEASRARLNELLHGNPEACESALSHLTLEADLHHEFGGQQLLRDALPPFIRPAAEARPPRPAAASAARLARFAAVLLLGAGISMLVSSVWTRPRLKDARVPADGVATLLFADNCRWRIGEGPAEGQRLSASRLQLEQGLAILRFDGGAAVVLEGPADLDVESRGCARLNAGRLTVRAPKEAAGFTVRSPASDVVDLGTEFAIMVERGGATEVHVLEGEVSYSKPGAPMEAAELPGAENAVRLGMTKLILPELGHVIRELRR